MSYLDIARAARKAIEVETAEGSGATSRSTDCEISEKGEKSRDLLPPDAVDQLKARIVAVVSVDPLDFDRVEYDRLWTLYKARATEGEAP